jgi:hypothetical protein
MPRPAARFVLPARFAPASSCAPTMAPAPKRENLFLNLVCTLVLPAVVLSQLSKPERLGPELALGVALTFPLGYGIRDFIQRRKFNLFAAIGILSTLLTGGFGLARLNAFWFSVKEASVPLVIGVIALLSAGSKRPLIAELLYNDEVIDKPKVSAALVAKNMEPAFAQRLRSCTHLVAASFILSAVLNFIVTAWVLLAEPGTDIFNDQLSKLMIANYVIITPPTLAIFAVALWRLINGITGMTGLPLEDILHARPEKPAGAPRP